MKQTLTIEVWWPEHTGPIDDARSVHRTRDTIGNILSTVKTDAFKRLENIDPSVVVTTTLSPPVAFLDR